MLYPLRDRMHSIKEAALQRCWQEQLPVPVVGAGLPQLQGRMGGGKILRGTTFRFSSDRPPRSPDARDAIVRPAENEGAEVLDEAVDLIIEKTQGYPYFLQEWGKHAWDVGSDRVPPK